MFKRVLVLSPHTDDGELGAGGTIARLTESGSYVRYIAFSAHLEQLRDECMRATNVLGVSDTLILNYPRRYLPEYRQDILQMLYDTNEEFSPDLVLTPSTSDRHQDHETVTNEAVRIFKEHTMLGYEHPKNIIDFTENGVVPLEKKHLDLKLKSLSEYRSQREKHSFKPKVIEASAIRCGNKIHTDYAEVFEVIRFIMEIDPEREEN